MTEDQEKTLRRFKRKETRTSEDQTRATHLGTFRAEQRRWRQKLEGTMVRKPCRFVGRRGERKVGAEAAEGGGGGGAWTAAGRPSSQSGASAEKARQPGSGRGLQVAELLRPSYLQGPEPRPLRPQWAGCTQSERGSVPAAFIRHPEHLLRMDAAINLKCISGCGAGYFLKRHGGQVKAVTPLNTFPCVWK